MNKKGRKPEQLEREEAEKQKLLLNLKKKLNREKTGEEMRRGEGVRVRGEEESGGGGYNKGEEGRR